MTVNDRIKAALLENEQLVNNYFDVLFTVHCSNDQFWFQLIEPVVVYICI